MRVRILLFFTLFLINVNPTLAQNTAFTYQGKLTDGANPATGDYDMQFKLFDTATIGTGHQQGAAIINPSVSVTAGIFTVQLDFGAGVFSGPPRFLEIGVRQMGSPDPYTLLSPRQAVTSTPYSVRSLNSSVADVLSSACVGCVTSTQIGSVAGSSVTGTIPVASIPAGSDSYVQNTISEQAPASFNIRGSGTINGSFSASTAFITSTASANIFNATTQFNIGGSRAFTVLSFSQNVFAGVNAGAANGIGGSNSFFGHGAGEVTSSGGNNSFFGRSAGNANTASNNSFFGTEAGFGNTSGTRNSNFGLGSGRNNLMGNDNAFFGYHAGFNSTGGTNSFFGSGAGDSNTNGLANAFFGYNAGTANISGLDNAFFGNQTGLANTASYNTFVGAQAGSDTTSGGFNTFVGTFAGNTNTTGDHNTFIGYNANVDTGSFSYSTVIGAGAVGRQSNEIKLGRDNGFDTVFIPGEVQMLADAKVEGDALILGNTHMSGLLRVEDIRTGGSISLCVTNNLFGILALCSSSLRYKTSVQPFSGGLDIVRRLRPITFDWKDGGMHDVGFGAEEVEQIEPLLTTRNSKGEIEGVKYGQVTTVLVNALKEQQAQIEEQKEQIAEQQKLLQHLHRQNQAQQQQLQEHKQAQEQQLRLQKQQLEALKSLVCSSHPQAEACK